MAHTVLLRYLLHEGTIDPIQLHHNFVGWIGHGTGIGRRSAPELLTK